MKYYKIKDETLNGIADAIREKNGTSDAYTPGEMAQAIGQIQGGAEYHIAYGDTAPEDTSKLWIKCAEPIAVKTTSRPVVAQEGMACFASAIPEALRYMVSQKVGSKIYLFGGIYDHGGYGYKIFEYDPSSNSVSQLSTQMEWAGYLFPVAAVGTKIYLFGGRWNNGDTNKIYVFDTNTKYFYDISTVLPYNLIAHTAAAYDGKIFLFGGKVEDGDCKTSILMFDSTHETITTLSAQLPNANGIAYHTTAVVGSKAYLFGGWDPNGELADIHVFDMAEYTMTTLDVKLPQGTRSIGTAVVGTKIYLLGGRSATAALSDIQVLDTETNTLSELSVSLPTSISYSTAEAVGGNVYVFGGYDGTANLTSIHKLVAELPLDQNHILIETTLTDNLVSLLPGMEVGIANVYLGSTEGKAERVDAAVYRNGAWVEI